MRAKGRLPVPFRWRQSWRELVCRDLWVTDRWLAASISNDSQGVDLLCARGLQALDEGARRARALVDCVCAYRSRSVAASPDRVWRLYYTGPIHAVAERHSPKLPCRAARDRRSPRASGRYIAIYIGRMGSPHAHHEQLRKPHRYQNRAGTGAVCACRPFQ